MAPDASAKEQLSIVNHSDAAVCRAADDKLGRAPFALAVGDIVQRIASGPSTIIGIYGAWGEGKTSLLNMVDEALATHPTIRCERFNPWRLQDEEAQLRHLFELIGHAADVDIASGKKALSTLLKQMAILLKAAKLKGGSDGTEVVVDLSAPIDVLAARLDYLSLDQLRVIVERELQRRHRSVVIMIDDVDRLDRHEIRRLMRILKLCCDFTNTVYILACDEEVVAEAIGADYGAGGVADGRAFLEKIVQIPLRLPSADRLALLHANLQFVLQVLAAHEITLNEIEQQEFLRCFRLGLEAECCTVRHGKRYANALLVTLGLVKGEVHAVDFMLVEGLRVFFPTAYREIERHADLLIQPSESGPRGHKDAEAIRALVTTATEGLSSHQSEAVQILVRTLFPLAASALGGQNFGGSVVERWTRERRVASKRHLSRYFSLQVPVTDVLDSEIQGVLVLVRAMDLDGASDALRRLVTHANAQNVIERLWEQVPSMAGADAGRLMVAIGHSADRLPRERAGLFSTGDMAAIAVRQLMERIGPPQDRLEWIRRLADYPTPVGFAVECMRNVIGGRESDQAEAILEERGAAEIRGRILSRIESELATADGLLPTGVELLMLCSGLLWWGTPDRAHGILDDKVRSQPENAQRLITAFAGKGQLLETGITTRGRLIRNSYDALCELVSGDVLMSSLRKIHGVALVGDSNEHGGASEELLTAREFVRIHEAVLREGKQQEVRELLGAILENESPDK